jgi:hypothetical protein
VTLRAAFAQALAALAATRHPGKRRRRDWGFFACWWSGGGVTELVNWMDGEWGRTGGDGE